MLEQPADAHPSISPSWKLRHVADVRAHFRRPFARVQAEHLSSSLLGAHQIEQYLERRALASAVGSNQQIDGTCRNLERYVVQCYLITESLGESSCIDGELAVAESRW